MGSAVLIGIAFFVAGVSPWWACVRVWFASLGFGRLDLLQSYKSRHREPIRHRASPLQRIPQMKRVELLHAAVGQRNVSKASVN
jgi:hypothetical protein